MVVVVAAVLYRTRAHTVMLFVVVCDTFCERFENNRERERRAQCDFFRCVRSSYLVSLLRRASPAKLVGDDRLFPFIWLDKDPYPACLEASP